jgi:hypothetical protein
MQDIECNPQAALLTFLNLSGDPSLAPPASGTSQTDSPTLSALWKRNGTWGDWALYTASPLRAFEKCSACRRRLAFGTRLASPRMAAPVNSARRRHRYIDVPYQISTVVDEGLAMRLREPHLDGDLIAKEGAAVLMRDYSVQSVCCVADVP